MGFEAIKINLLKAVGAVKSKAGLPNSDFDAVKWGKNEEIKTHPCIGFVGWLQANCLSLVEPQLNAWLYKLHPHVKISDYHKLSNLEV